MKRFFVDAETDGLYGRFLSVAALATDEEGKEIDRFYGACHITAEQLSSAWTVENVLPHLQYAECFFEDEYSLLEAFWAFWIAHREGAACIAYVPYPVESRLFTACVMHDRAYREFLGPFPLYDLATLLVARGFDYDVDMPTLSGITCAPHDAMNDVRMMAAVWGKLCKM